MNVRVLQKDAPAGVVEYRSTAMIPIQDMNLMAAAVARSGLFGLKTADQALAMMLIAQAEGRHPAEAARDYDIIQGRPAKKAEAMLRDFLSSGGKVEWHALDDTIADATFSHPQGGAVRISWDMARAKKAGLGTKDMWAKYPRQMLRSRTVSEGVRTVWPMATSGMYVPEEVRDFESKDMGHAERVDPPKTEPEAPKPSGKLDHEYEARIMGVIKAAINDADLHAIDDDAMAACKEVGDRDAAKRIRKAIKDRAAEIASAGPPTLTASDIIAQLRAANDTEELYESANLIDAITDPVQRAECVAMFDTRMTDLTTTP